MKSLLSFIQTFVPFFALFAIIGAVAGFSARENVAVEKLVAETHLLPIDGQYFLQQNCAESGLILHYAIDTNKAVFDGSVSAKLSQVRQQLDLPPARFNEYRSLLGSFLGGTTGGFQLRSALKKPPGGWSRSAVQKTVFGVLASVTGYHTGHYLSSHYNTDCDSELVAAILNNSSQMIGVERARLNLNLKILENLPDAELSLMGTAIENRQKDPAFMCSTLLNDLGNRLANALNTPDLDPDSGHFSLIDDIAQLHATIEASVGYPDLLAGQLYKHQPQLLAFDAASGVGKLRAERVAAWDSACNLIDEIPGLSR